ncbi:MAG: phosphoribosylanthranilate isomerase [candidate division WS1 bacterium]|nr:phosphoribosylanthranilate isomerase [candidate division WS1 bacterium]
MATPWIKICGLTCVPDLHLALDLGARYVGCIWVPTSPRCVSLPRARELAGAAGDRLVLVVRNLPLPELGDLLAVLRPGVIQLHGEEPPDLARDLRAAHPEVVLWKALGVSPRAGDPTAETARLLALARAYEAAGVHGLLLDTQGSTGSGGTGQTGDWQVAAQLVRSLEVPLILAGGLCPENVENAARQVQPAGLDLSSGVESSPGKKSHERLEALFTAYKRLR